MRGRLDFAEAAAHTCSLQAGVMEGNYSACWGQSEKNDSRKSWSSRLSSTSQRPGPRGSRGECCPPDPLGNGEGTHSRRCARAFCGTCVIRDDGNHHSCVNARRVRSYFSDQSHKAALLKKRQLQGDLYERVRTHLLFFDELLPVSFKSEHIHVEIIHQPAVKTEKRAL